MLLRIVGALCVFVTCGGIGFYLAYRYANEERLLLQLLDVLNYMDCEIMYRMTPLPALCRQASVDVPGILQTIFTNLANELEQQISPDVSSCMNVVIHGITGIPSNVFLILDEMGKQFGRFDLLGQQKGIELLKQKIYSILNSDYSDKTNRIRNYRTLGVCAGISLVILLF